MTGGFFNNNRQKLSSIADSNEDYAGLKLPDALSKSAVFGKGTLKNI